MENKKFRVVTEIVDGKPVRKFLPVEEAKEPECHLYGGYVACGKDEIQAAKDAQLESIFEVIREVAKDDRFWIVKDTGEVGKVTVAWKIDFPQMYGI